MREEHPEWGIETELVKETSDFVVFKATIRNEAGRVLATGTSLERYKSFGFAVESAETSAIGRALGFLGYGTQFLEDEARIVDAPVELEKPKAPQPVVVPSQGAELIQAAFGVMPEHHKKAYINRLTALGFEPATFTMTHANKSLSEISTEEAAALVNKAKELKGVK